MASIDQVIAQIRFQLDQISIKNSHHEFEHLCRFLARVRICSNILPATGPVSGGGDQGRDFESFKTYLKPNTNIGSTFIRLITDKVIVFACSTEKKEKISAKIKADIIKNMNESSDVDVIHFFCTADIQVKQRHKLKNWAKDTYKIEIEIHDGQSISELLADPEIFWIAERYLSIPKEIFPVLTENKNNGYKALLKKWKDIDYVFENWADLSEIKACVRYVAFSGLKEDILIWYNLLEKFINSDFHYFLKLSALHEIIILSWKGFDTLFGQEAYIRQYFSEISSLKIPSYFKDAYAILTYASTAFLCNKVNLNKTELVLWQKSLVDSIDKQFTEITDISTKCELLEARGFVCLALDLENLAMPKIDEAIIYWMEMVKLAEKAFLFPLETFSNDLSEIIKILPDVPGKIDELSEQLNKLLAIRLGNAAVAYRCLQDGIIYYEKHMILRAIRKFQESIYKWFTNETLDKSLQSILYTSYCYGELGLFYAARHYAIAASAIALNFQDADVNSIHTKALFIAAECDYFLGSWHSFLKFVQNGLRSHWDFSKEAGNINGSSRNREQRARKCFVLHQGLSKNLVN